MWRTVFESLKSSRFYAGWWDRVTSSAGSVRAALIYTLRPNIERCLVRSSVGSDEFIAFSFHSSLTYIHWPSDHKLTSSLLLFLNLKSRPMTSASRAWHHLSQNAFHSASCQNSCVWMLTYKNIHSANTFHSELPGRWTDPVLQLRAFSAINDENTSRIRTKLDHFSHLVQN